MAEILTQSEIDALISSLGAEQSEERSGANTGARGQSRAGESEAQAPHRRVRSYDFKRPDKFSKEQLRTLHVIHENFARLLTTYYTATFRTMVQLVVGSVDQSTYQEFMRSIHNPSVICPFTLHPLQGTCVLDINPVVGFPMIDRMFGGPGGALPRIRELTDIEATVIMRIVRGTLQALKDAWANIITVEPEPQQIETNPIFVQYAAPNDIVVTVAIDVRVGEHVGVITLCLPYLTLEPTLPKLSAHNWYGSGPVQQKEEDFRLLQQRIGNARVPVTIELGRTALSVRELLDLSSGDLVLLNRRVEEEVAVLVGNQPKFTAVPGQFRGRMAVQVTGLMPKGGLEDDE